MRKRITPEKKKFSIVLMENHHFRHIRLKLFMSPLVIENNLKTTG